MKKIYGMIMAGVICCSLGSAGALGQWQPETVQAANWDGASLVEGLDRSADYYILPNSDREKVAAETIAALSDNERQMAINEIYARHGRKFVISQVQQYFNEKSWYSGTVEASAFDENVFNDYENVNISRLLKGMSAGGSEDSGYRAEAPEIIVDPDGSYYRSEVEKEGYLTISLYTDVSAASAYEGQECGTISANVYYTDGSMLGLTGYLIKSSGNTYRLSGRNLNDAVLTVTSANAVISGSKGVDGTYEKQTSY